MLERLCRSGPPAADLSRAGQHLPPSPLPQKIPAGPGLQAAAIAEEPGPLRPQDLPRDPASAIAAATARAERERAEPGGSRN